MSRAHVVGLVVLLLSACGPTVRRYPQLTDRWLYTCCTLHFGKRLYASDANYSYGPDALTLPIGTRVYVMDDSPEELHIIAEGRTERLEFAFKFGTSRMTAEQYFQTIFVESDPRDALAGMPSAMAAAIQDGRLVEGMTKAQALMARGYPPFHRTDGIEADVWTYYDNPEQVDVVQFVDGKIAGITRTDAPNR